MNLNAARRLRRCVSGFSIAGWRTWRESNPHPLSRTRERDFAGHTSFDSFLVYQLGEPDPGTDGRSFVNTGLTFS